MKLDPTFYPDFLNQEREIDRALTVKEWKQARNVTLFVLMIDTGLRVGEITRLSEEHLWFIKSPVKVLTVPPHIAKGKRTREIPLSCKATFALARWFIKANYQFNEIPSFPAFPCRPSGGAITTRTVERIITAAAEKSIGICCNPHMLRHTFATRLMKITDIRTVQELLGHKSVASTQIYTHVTDDDMKEAITEMDSNNNNGICTAALSDLGG